MAQTISAVAGETTSPSMVLTLGDKIEFTATSTASLQICESAYLAGISSTTWDTALSASGAVYATKDGSVFRIVCTSGTATAVQTDGSSEDFLTAIYDNGGLYATAGSALTPAAAAAFDEDGNFIGSVQPRSGTLVVLTAITTALDGELSQVVDGAGAAIGVFQHYGPGIAGGVLYQAGVGIQALGPNAVAAAGSGVSISGAAFFGDTSIGEAGRLGLSGGNIIEGLAGEASDVDIALPKVIGGYGAIHVYDVTVIAASFTHTDQTNYAAFVRRVVIHSTSTGTSAIKNTQTIGSDVRAGDFAADTIAITITGTGTLRVTYTSVGAVDPVIQATYMRTSIRQ